MEGGTTYHGELEPLQDHILRERTLNRHSAQEAVNGEDTNSRAASAPNEGLRFTSASTLESPAIMPTNHPLVPRHLINKSELLRCVSGHPCDKVCSLILVAFLRDALKLLSADACALECAVDGRVVYRKEAVGLEEVQQLVEKVIRILLNKKLEVMNVVVVEKSEAPSKALVLGKDIACGPPQLEDAIPRAQGHAAAFEDIREVEQPSVVQSDGGDLDIARDSVRHSEICTEETRKSTKSLFPYSSIFRANCHKQCKRL